MNLLQLEAIYKANLPLGHLEALEAIFTHGFCDGAGIAVTANTASVVPQRTASATIIKLKNVDLR